MTNRSRSIVGVGAFLVAALCVTTVGAHAESEPVRYDPQTMTQPKPIHKVNPTYPQDAKEEGVEGIVVLDAVLTQEGIVRDTRVMKGEDTRLVDAAQAAVGQWRFEPALDANGEPVAVIFTVTIRFMLADK
jgi:protein TonB